MRRYVLLSYAINENTPCYPGTFDVKIKAVKEIEKMDSANMFLVTLSNHAGTHIDGPAHFYISGRRIGEYTFDELNFEKPLIIDCAKRGGEAIMISDLQDAISSSNPDILLLRTGFSCYRDADPVTYQHKNPYLLPECCEWIRNNQPALRAIGIDFISVSSCEHKQLGREAHKILLDEKRPGSEVIIIEDMRIPPEIKRLDEILVLPVISGSVDSSPCVAICVIND